LLETVCVLRLKDRVIVVPDPRHYDELIFFNLSFDDFLDIFHRLWQIINELKICPARLFFIEFNEF
jgi:hypothetical protein